MSNKVKAGLAAGQTAQRGIEEGNMAISGLHHVTLLVDDHAKAAWFYGDVLGLSEKPRPGFDFPGLFYHCGQQEIHLIIAPRLPATDDLVLRLSDGSTLSRSYIHRHAALMVSEPAALKERLAAQGVAILFDHERVAEDDTLAHNLIAGWMRMYGGVPLFFFDPFRNLLELVPGRQT
jgi:glyoxylase I family protein